MLTYSGRKVDPDLAELPSCEDIAVHLGRICRYAGAVWWPDLAHSVLVACILDGWGANDPTWARGLLHDAHEAITGDVTYPWKPPMLKIAQRRIDEKLFAKFHVMSTEVISLRLLDAADAAALVAEASSLGLPGWPEYYEEVNGYPPVLNERHGALVAALADSEFVLPQYCTRPDSIAVRTFAAVLELIEDGSIGLARDKLAEVVSKVT